MSCIYLFVMPLPLPAVLLLLILVLFYVKYHYPLLKALKKQSNLVETPQKEPVSVIIAARNELNNLKANLPLILEQNYADFEVVVINDHSYDGTADYLKELAQEEERIKVVTVETDERFKRGKKFALTMGIKAAKNDLLLFTDADCKPASKNWINLMVQQGLGKELVLGYGHLQTPPTLLGLLVKFETLQSAINYFGYALKNEAYMGVGRNLMYRKDLFFKHKGFASHQHIISGDDDLFVQEASTASNTTTALLKDSFTVSAGPSSWSAWYTQKKRHHSTAKVYKKKFKRNLGVFSFSQIFFYVAIVLQLILFPKLWYYSVGLVVLKWIIQVLIQYKPAKHFGFKFYALYLPLCDVMYTLYLLIFGLIYPFAKVKKWS
jgi:biofilm PGA synthesis N-glycosyltransferase PgaC